MFQSMRKSAMRLVLIQAAAGILAGAFAGLMFGSAAGAAAISGAGIGLAGSLFMVAGLLRVRTDATPGQMLARVLAGEAVKWAVTAAGFAVCSAGLDMHFLGLLGGFVATLLGYWAGLLPAVLGEAVRPPVPSAR